jgi:hypothetical protein
MQPGVPVVKTGGVTRDPVALDQSVLIQLQK